LSLQDSAHAPQGGPPQQDGFSERSAYVPPHMRQRGPGPAPSGPPPPGPGGFSGPPPGGMQGSAWAPK
jgi:ATP-dependent RNA helicase DDX3X